MTYLNAPCKITLENFTLTVLALEELKELGYKEVWIGKVECPHWDWMSDSNIIASPKNEKNGWPALWGHAKLQMFCGNGLKSADQMQASHNLLHGYYKLENNIWQTNVFDKIKNTPEYC